MACFTGRPPHPVRDVTRPRAAGIRLTTALWIVAALAVPSLAHAQTAEAPPAKATPKRTKAAAPAANDAAALPGAPAKRDPAAAQAAVEAAAKQLEAGKTDQAVATLTTAISGGSLPPAVMARALYLRGSAYRKQTKPALAISDLTSALWLKGGLNEVDKADATAQRNAAYAEAGVGSTSPTTEAEAAARKRRDVGTPSAALNAGPAQSGSASGGFFKGLFGGGTASSTPAEPPQTSRAVAPAPIPAPIPLQAATTPPPSAPVRIAAATVPAAAKAAAPAGNGRYHTRIALVRTKAEADAVVSKLKTQYATAISGKTPSVSETAFGNMGAFFQVRVGPFAAADDAQALCAQLKGSGLDCVPVNQ
jgi:SPOR domain